MSFMNKFEDGTLKKGICQRDNNPIKKQKTAKSHLWVFNTGRKSHTLMGGKAGP